MAAKKRNAPPPPPSPPAAAHDTSSDEDSSSDEKEQFIAKPNPTKAENPNSDRDKMDSDSGSESESESEKSPPTKPVASLQKPSESEDSQSKKTTPKSSEADLPPSKKSPIIQRVWSLEGEVTLLQALLAYKVKNGKLPPKQEYPTFLSTFSASLGFPVTEKQLFNKIRTFKFTYGQKKKKGDNATFQQPHDAMVFKICRELFGDVGESSKGGAAQEPSINVGKKNHKKMKMEVGGSALVEANGGTASVVADVANDGVKNSGDGVRRHFYLSEMIRTEQSLRWLSADDMMARIEESRLQDLEAKAKKLQTKEMKLHAREAQLVVEMLDLVADAVEND